MDNLIMLLRDGTIARSIITLVMVCVWSYLIGAGQTVPDAYNTVVLLVIGYYFGADVTPRIKEVAAQYIPRNHED